MTKESSPLLHSTCPHLRRRRHAEQRLRAYGLCALAFATAMITLLIISIASNGFGAFMSSQVTLELLIDEEVVGAAEASVIRQAPLQSLVNRALDKKFPQVTTKKELLTLYSLVSRSAAVDIQHALLDDLSLVGQTLKISLPLSANAEAFVRREEAGKLSESQQLWLKQMIQQGDVHTGFNTNFFTGTDSRDPMAAGIFSSFIGSMLTIIVCLLLCFPFGVAAAIYLEEVAKKNRFTDMIEININNLAAVPSIIFGLLGLSIFLQLFGMPRSSSLVGGATLSMLVLPTIIIATRNALKAVPPSIRDAARALGATEIQVVLHHTLPLALPGIMTGAILSVARALGETAPLLMIGMVAFIADVPTSFLHPSTTLPVQIYLWSDSPEAAFAEKTSACILLLIMLLAILNFTAAFIRNRFEKRW